MADFYVFEDHGGGWSPRTSYSGKSRQWVETQMAKLLSQDFSQMEDMEGIAKRVAIFELGREDGQMHFRLHEYEVKPAKVHLQYIK